MLDRIKSLASLPAGWDSHDAEPITSIAIERACQLAQVLREDVLCVPTVRGGVEFEAAVADGAIVVEIFPDGWLTVEFVPE